VSFSSTFPQLRLRPTRWGLIFLGALLVLGFAAVNTSNNALMALLGLALASYVVSGAWSRQVLALVHACVESPRELFAGRAAIVELELANPSRWLPAYGLVVRDQDDRPVLTEALLPSSARRRHGVEVVCQRRGWRELGPWRLDVLMPLGFFTKSKRLLAGRRVLVYPSLLPSGGPVAGVVAALRRGDHLRARGREGDVLQLRDYRAGDDRRQLHWKQTARQQRPIVVDRQQRAEQQPFLVLDPRLSDPSDPRLRERFERMVSEVATVVVRSLNEGCAVGLVIGSTVIPPVASPGRRGRLLRPLAEVEPMPTDAPPPAVVAGRTIATWRVERGG
jgi:uncharacterized protein (DUF58 family)